MQLFLLLTACGTVELGLGEAPPPETARAPADADVDPPNAIVDCDGGADFTTLADAIEAAADGDLLHVGPCTYTESIDFGGKMLRIVSTNGSADTIVEGRSGSPVVRAATGEGTGTTLAGFTLRNGGSNGEAAVVVDFASLRLEDVVLEDNRGYTTIYGASADVELSGVTLRDNRESYGMSIYMSRGGLLASDLSVECSGATGLYLGHGAALLDRLQVDCGTGTAVNWEHAVGHLQRSVLGGGVYVLSEDDHYDDFVYVTNTIVGGSVAATYGSVVVRNSVVTGGVSTTTVYLDSRIEGSVITGARCGITSDTSDYTIRNNLFWDNGANVCGGVLTDPVGDNGNVQADPLFTDARGGDWTLAAGSPGIDAGPEDDDYADVDGSRNDIGAYGGPLSIGGGW